MVLHTIFSIIIPHKHLFVNGKIAAGEEILDGGGDW